MHRRHVPAALILASLSHAASAGFSLHQTDSFVTPPTDMEPITDKDGNSKWAKPPWNSEYPATGTPDSASGTIPNFAGTLAPGESMGYGLDNFFVKKNTKTFKITCSIGPGGKPQTSTPGFGYSDPFQKGTATKISSIIDKGIFTEVWTITPQPSWEFITIKNAGDKTLTITALTLSSTCTLTPAPGPLALGAAGVVLLLRRHR